MAATLGLRGMPGACEALGVERGILLSELTGSAFHVAHMSARASLRAVRKGKEAGVRVTCEVAPHHFTLTDEALGSPIPYDTNTKMNPPLREAADRDAMLERHRRRQRRRHCHRPRAASLRREEGRVRSRAVRHRRAGDRGPAVAGPSGPLGTDPAAAARRAVVGEPVANPRRRRADRSPLARRPTSRSSRRTCACASTRRGCARGRRTRRSTDGSCAAAWRRRSSAAGRCSSTRRHAWPYDAQRTKSAKRRSRICSSTKS